MISKTQTILYVCPGKGWGSRERSVIRDFQVAQKHGLHVILYCIKDSFLDRHTQTFDVEKLYYYRRTKFTFLDWYRLLGLSNETIKQVSLVHCYEHSFIWSCALFLTRRPLIPLVVSLYEKLDRSFIKLWRRFLLGRIDLVLVPISSMLEEAALTFALPFRKIEFYSMGMAPIVRSSKGQLTFDNCHSLGLLINRHLEKKEDIIAFFYLLKLLNSDQTNKFKIVFCAEEAWGELPIYRILKELTSEFNLDDNVIFVEEINVYLVQKSVDLWIGLPSKEVVDDYAISALYLGAPVLFPRTSWNIELLLEIGQVGETYRAADVRELRNKCQTIFSSYEEYKEVVRKKHSKIAFNYGITRHEEQLITFYKKVITKRERYNFLKLRKKRAKAPIKKVDQDNNQ